MCDKMNFRRGGWIQMSIKLPLKFIIIIDFKIIFEFCY